MLELQERLCLPVTSLLAQVGARVLPPVMPDESARRDGDPVARLLQAPADIDIVAGLAVLPIEAIDRFQRLPAKSHVAAGNMLGNLVALEDVHWLAGGCRHARRKPTVGRTQVGSADCRRPAALQLADQMSEPVVVHVTIGIG